MSVVLDASVVVAALTDLSPDGSWAEAIIRTDFIAAPELVLVESANVLRRLERAAAISTLQASTAHADLLRLDIALFPYEPVADRAWELRHNLTAYDAWYVALAESLGCPVATLDRKMTQAVGPLCSFLTPDG